MCSRISCFLLAGILFCLHASAQDVTVRGHFLEHKAKIGEQIPYVLSAQHPASQSILFPDSSFSFAPFEIQRKLYFPTRTKNNISYDSAVYYLTTFEIDSLQSLALPVFVLQKGDCTSVFTRPDTVRLQLMVGTIPDTVEAKDLPLKTNTDYLTVSWLLNYPLLLMIAGGIVIVLIIVWIIFGKRIRKYFRLRKLRKNHVAFLSKFNPQINKVQENNSSLEAESAMVVWKKYMESLAGKPYTKLTTKEILRLASDETLGQALHTIDRMIYAGGGSFSVEAFDRLRTFSQEQFTQKMKEVMRG